MTQAQYKKFLNLSQANKKAFIAKAKKAGMNSHDIYWLEFGYQTSRPEVQKAMFAAIQ